MVYNTTHLFAWGFLLPHFLVSLDFDVYLGLGSELRYEETERTFISRKSLRALVI